MRPDRIPLALGAILGVIVVGGWLLPPWASFIATVAIARGLVALGLVLLDCPLELVPREQLQQLAENAAYSTHG